MDTDSDLAIRGVFLWPNAAVTWLFRSRGCSGHVIALELWGTVGTRIIIQLWQFEYYSLIVAVVKKCTYRYK